MFLKLQALCCTVFALLILGSTYTAYAGENDEGVNALSARIAHAHQSGVAFAEVSLFAPAQGDKHFSLLESATILQPLQAPIATLYASRPQAIHTTLRSDDGKSYSLELLLAHPTASGGNFGYIDTAGRHRISMDAGLHYQGSITGNQKSLAAMSIFENGDIMLLFANGEGNFVVGKIEDGSGKYIMYNDRNFKNRPYRPCGVTDQAYKPGEVTPVAAKTSSVLQCRKVSVYWEISYGIYTNRASSLTATRNYVLGVFNQFQALYANDALPMELKSMYIWITPDEVPTNNSSPALDRFTQSWNLLDNGFDADIAHFLAHAGGLGGLAFVDILCSRGSAYAYSDVDVAYQTIPTWSWDVEVLAHETGHNLGSKHTHWCGWNTGAGGSCGSIDDCTTLEAGTGCTTCGSTLLNSAPTSAWQGTIMSYCHLTSRGINLANGFGPLPGNLLRANFAKTCLSNTISATLLPSKVCGTGSISLVFDANNLGTPPYTYTWSNNARTQNLASVSPAGTYTVVIRDSNNCTATDTVNLPQGVSPGNGIAPTQRMPICCNNSGPALHLSASAPVGFTSCYDVFWLRSAFPIASYDAAKTFFDTTQPTNIFASANSGSISSTTAALLDVHPPTSCATPQTRYYTPVVVQGRATADSIVATGTSSNLMFIGTRIGGTLTLPDQTALPTACELLDTPTSQSLLIPITGYTGRANRMTVVVQDADGKVLFMKRDVIGNSTFIATPIIIPGGSFLQAMKISIFDYNCTGNNCVSSQVSFSARRKVEYGSHLLRLYPKACVVGTSVRVDFAQNGCTKLDVENTGAQAPTASLFPNPASHTATLVYSGTGNMQQLKVTDMLGKTILLQGLAATTGQHQQVLDVQTWAKGIYFVSISGNGAADARLKLVVE